MTTISRIVYGILNCLGVMGRYTKHVQCARIQQLFLQPEKHNNVLMTCQKTGAKTLISPLVEDFNKNIMKADKFMKMHKHTAYE